MIKGQKKGFLLPPAVGYSFKVLFFLFGKHSISLRYLPRTIITVLINIVNWPFRVYEKAFINRRFKNKNLVKEPVFILGHWRSGTTHLHNILCQDPQMGYVSTFQSVFPDTLFNKLGRFVFEGFARILIPGTRKGDNVILGTGLPQEEEFALGDKTPISLYYFWMFPRYIIHFYNRFVRLVDTDPRSIASWKKEYELLIHKALANTKRTRFLSKNPPNTGRVEVLLDMFPNAKFIHIHRNPIEVYLSTRNFFHKMLPHLQLQTIHKEELEDVIFELYKNIMTDYLGQRSKIQPKNLVEISFSELEEKPMACIQGLYENLDLAGFQESELNFQTYLNSKKSYQKNKHRLTSDLIERIRSEWGFAMEEWSYDVPEHIEIIDSHDK